MTTNSPTPIQFNVTWPQSLDPNEPTYTTEEDAKTGKTLPPRLNKMPVRMLLTHTREICGQTQERTLGLGLEEMGDYTFRQVMVRLASLEFKDFTGMITAHTMKE